MKEWVLKRTQNKRGGDPSFSPPFEYFQIQNVEISDEKTRGRRGGRMGIKNISSPFWIQDHEIDLQFETKEVERRREGKEVAKPEGEERREVFTPLKFILSKSDRMLRAEKYDSSLDSMNGFDGEEMGEGDHWRKGGWNGEEEGKKQEVREWVRKEEGRTR